MASPFQQQSLRRKFIYFGLILGLFTLTLVIRRSGAYSMESMANTLEIREQNLGEGDLIGSVLQLSLSGSRGMVICYLWVDAEGKKKKHEWNQLDQRVRILVKLQPHFISPWLFQSWNLAYNVAVELDRVRDKYFYVARGIDLLAEGERKNRDNPEMRFSIGNYTQSKIGISDENNTMRSLFQMSCMNPADRNPARFHGKNGELDWTQFQDFCKNHPLLVRRLRENLRCKTPEDIVEFLRDNQKIPSRYEDPEAGSDQDTTKFKPLTDRFPALPPASQFDPSEFTFNDNVGDDFDCYGAARAWYSYAQDPLHSAKKKRPRYMAKIIFQGYPARAQAYVAERLQQEGWFDEDGWEITGWKPESLSNPDGPKTNFTVGDGPNWSGNAWEKAHQMYKDHGEKNKLYLTPEDLRSLPTEERMDYEYNRNLTNFNHFYYRSMVERTREAVLGRKDFFKADRLRKAAEYTQALQMYESPNAFGPPQSWPKDKATGWKRLLLNNTEFRRDEDIQEEIYLVHYRYLKLLRDRREAPIRQLLVVNDLLSQKAYPWSPWNPLPLHASGKTTIPYKDFPFKGPLDDVDNEGRPFFTPDVVQRAQGRIGGAPSVLPEGSKLEPVPPVPPRVQP
ncbi:MAG TPA: hypothetical protein VGY77_00335 [Gemmataceae bacterium]|jgi:hypothetical protein|nr:hypothetical protein [Gemmataceae bacterium]